MRTSTMGPASGEPKASRLRMFVPTLSTLLSLGKAARDTFAGIQGLTEGHVFLNARGREGDPSRSSAWREEEARKIDEDSSLTEAQKVEEKEALEANHTSNVVIQAQNGAFLQSFEDSVGVLGQKDAILAANQSAFLEGKAGVFIGAGSGADFSEVKVDPESDTPRGTPPGEIIASQLEEAATAAEHVAKALEIANGALAAFLVTLGAAKNVATLAELALLAGGLTNTWWKRAGEGEGNVMVHAKGALTAVAEKHATVAAHRALALLAPIAELTGFAVAEVKGGVSAALSGGAMAKVYGGFVAEVVSLGHAGLLARRGVAEVVGKGVEIGEAHASLFQAATAEVGVNAVEQISLTVGKHGDESYVHLAGEHGITARGETIDFGAKEAVRLTTGSWVVDVGHSGVKILNAPAMKAFQDALDAATKARTEARLIAKGAYDGALSSAGQADEAGGAAMALLEAWEAAAVALNGALAAADAVYEQAVGAATATMAPSVTLTTQGVTLSSGGTKITLSSRGITLDAGAGEIKMVSGSTPFSLTAAGLKMG